MEVGDDYSEDRERKSGRQKDIGLEFLVCMLSITYSAVSAFENEH